MGDRFTESTVEDAALDLFGELGYEVVHGPEIGPASRARSGEKATQTVLAQAELLAAEWA